MDLCVESTLVSGGMWGCLEIILGEDILYHELVVDYAPPAKELLLNMRQYLLRRVDNKDLLL
jgi:hypothetical protein